MRTFASKKRAKPDTWTGLVTVAPVVGASTISDGSAGSGGLGLVGQAAALAVAPETCVEVTNKATKMEASAAYTASLVRMVPSLQGANSTPGDRPIASATFSQLRSSCPSSRRPVPDWCEGMTQSLRVLALHRIAVFLKEVQQTG